ncbi:50S ribosomal protein L29 [Candidatus Gastranaerophilus sp. (ex Termes propinquus)]|nr:50S ribosomal protein L29 [Candidatus Gastranaerophilus sp. (ex Termes propinquus)]
MASKLKLQEIREKTVEELKEQVLNFKKELFSFRMKHNKMNQLEDTSQIRETKRKIAQIKTIIREQELKANKEVKNA